MKILKCLSTKIDLFNSLVLPILTYACEVWGFCKADQLDRMFLGFFKTILCVRKTIPTAFIYNELGIYPLRIVRQIRILKYWFKILKMQDTNPIKIIYKLQVSEL